MTQIAWTIPVAWLCLASPAAAGETGTEPERAPFEELVAGAEVQEGLFDTYRKGDHLYLAIPAERFGRELLVIPRIAGGIGARWLYANQIYDRVEAEVVVLERHGERIFLKQVPHRFTAERGSPSALSVERSFGASVLASAPVAGERGDGAVVVDVHPWVVSDLFNVERWVREGLGEPGEPTAVSVDPERSHLLWVKSYPENLEIRSQLTFRPARPEVLDTVPDGRFVPLAMHFSFVEPAAEPMEARPADDRMGFTLSVRKDFSRRGDPTFFRRIANRWRLEPGEKVGDGYRPVRPIVFYLDPTIPEIYRPYVAAGIEAWSSTFEAAGWVDAIRAEPLPPGADPADARYATVTWLATGEGSLGAFGNSIVDPRSGEILDADVVVDAGYVEQFHAEWQAVVAPRRDGAPWGGGLGDGRDGRDGDGWSRLAGEAALLRLALRARSDLGSAPDLPSLEMVGEAIRYTVLHEVGHDLGLHHNFRASAATPLERLHDRAWTAEHGISASVMDYLAINLAPLGELQGDLFLTAPGPYDRWAISYLYTRDPEAARALARDNGEGFKAFGGDVDLYAPGAVDPLTAAWDLSDDPLAWSQGRTMLVRQLLPLLPEIVLDEGARYADLSDAVDVLGWHYFTALHSVVRYVGGLFAHRDHVGDAGGRPPFEPVPRATQRAALAYLAAEAFGRNAFPVPPEVQRWMGPRNWDHWGHPGTYEGRLDPPYLRRVLAQQTELLAALTDPLRLARILDVERAYGAAATLSIPELMGTLTEAIWQEVWTAPPGDVPTERRDLQRAWLERMIHLLLAADENLPADARSVARAGLVDLDRRLTAALAAGGLDAYTRAHLAEASARIGAALEAQLTAALP